ncbi:MAG: hypothetical protein ACJASH_001370 [Bermanella sp.]|jgi:hypothetical protein
MPQAWADEVRPSAAECFALLYINFSARYRTVVDFFFIYNCMYDAFIAGSLWRIHALDCLTRKWRSLINLLEVSLLKHITCKAKR